MRTGRIVSVVAGFCAVVGIQAAAEAQRNQGLTTPAAQYFMNRQTNTAVEQQMAAAPTGRTYDANRQPLQVGDGKPFDHVQRQSSLSPYLGLDAVPESGTSLPNWHLFVQPQLQQRRSAEIQARELLRTRQQMRVATSRHIVSESPPAGAPITGSSTQFMNVGGYFPGVR
jgi:hypothetical protein